MSERSDTAAKLSDLERRLAALRVENQRLRNLLRLTDGAEPPPEQPTLAASDPGLVTNDSPPEAKLALYLRLFAARRDVYAHYWENARKRTKGWSPVVRDRFSRGSLWDRRPLPLTDAIVADHLHKDTETFIGLYPLLSDATCWWLAADFDGPQAMLDAHAYVKAAASLGVPCAVEISQSGRGAHAWTFFTAPVAASDARAMGTACVHRAMGLRGSMPLASYDRLFPNQDTVPTGSSGVGNLIAAPLNGKRRVERHTTLFVDLTTWEPWPDQWEYLSRLDRMTPRQVAAVGRRDRIRIGSELTTLEASPATVVQPKPPVRIRGSLGSRLTIRDEDLTPGLSAALRHAATIHNPAFYEAQRARRSTWSIPRFIQGFDVAVNGDLILPRGLREQAVALIAQAGSEKTSLASQWRDQLQKLLGIKAGQLGGGRTKRHGQVDIMLLQSLARRTPEEVRELTATYGQVIVDECHHVAAGSYENVVSQIGAAWWLGLTATPERKDGLEQVTTWQLGPVRHVIKDTLPGEATLVTPYDGPQRRLHVHETRYRCRDDLDLAVPGAITQLGGLLATDADRNRQIAADIAEALQHGRKCLVLSRRRDHLTELVALLPDADAMIMRGGTGARELAAIRARIADANPADPLLIMTTVPYAGEGFDAPIIDTIFLVGPISYPGLVVQAVGRALRRHEGKTEVIVHDYLDEHVPCCGRSTPGAGRPTDSWVSRTDAPDSIGLDAVHALFCTEAVRTMVL